MTTPNDLSDTALVVFAFVPYHQLGSADVLTCIVSNDASGHRPDPAAVAELVQKQLGTQTDDWLHLTD